MKTKNEFQFSKIIQEKEKMCFYRGKETNVKESDAGQQNNEAQE